MRMRGLLTALLVAAIASSALAQRRPGGRRSSSATASTFPGTALAPTRFDYAWSTSACLPSPTWDPLVATSGGANANIPQGVNTTHTCDASTAPTGDGTLFGNASGLRAQGVGTSLVNHAANSAAGQCFFDTTLTGFNAIADNTDFVIRVVYNPTGSASVKNIFQMNFGATEYARLASNAGNTFTFTLREGASGNVTISSTPILSTIHVEDWVYDADSGNDGGAGAICLYKDGQLQPATGGTQGNCVEMATNMAAFNAWTSISMLCDTVEAGLYNGDILFVGLAVGGTMSAWMGSDPTAWLAQHRTDCQDLGICTSAQTDLIIHYGQSLAQGFNSTGTSAVTVATNVAQATVSANHGIRLGDRITTTGHTTNTASVLTTAVDATHVSYPLVASDGPLADGVGTITLNAHTLTQVHNFRECRNAGLSGALPLLIEGTAGSGGSYESPLSATINSLAETYGRTEMFVGFELAVSDRSIIQLNNDTTDGVATTTEYTNLNNGISDCNTRVGGLGSATKRAVVNDDQGEGSSTQGADQRRTEWSEYETALQESLDTAIKAITGQSEEVAICFNQTNNFTSTPLVNATIMEEQLDAHEIMSNGGRAYLTGPKYWIYTSDGTHLTGEGYDLSACLFSRCDNAVLSGGSWSPTRPTAQTFSSNSILVDVYTPTPPLVIDTVNVGDPGSYGFEYFDSDPSAANPTISSVNVGACTGNTCPVTIAMSASPDHAGARIRYAYSGSSGVNGGPFTGGRGCLRDSFGDGTRTTCANASNWLASFDKPVARTFVDDYAWDFNNTQEECDAADTAGQEAPNGLGQTASSLVVDAWIKPTAAQLADRQIVGKSNDTTLGWSLKTETAGAGYAVRFSVGANTQWFEFANDTCGSPFDNCTQTTHTTPLTNGQWAHVACSEIGSRGTFATTAVDCTSNQCTATIASVPSYIVVGQQAVTSGHTVNTPATGGAISAVTGTTIVYALTTGDVHPMADGVGSLTVNDAKIKCYVSQCDNATPPSCGTLTEVLGITNGEMPATFTDTAQPLRVGGWGSGVNNVGYMGGRIGELAYWYSDSIDASGTTSTHRSYSASEVRACLETSGGHKPVDRAQLSGTVYNDSGVYKSCNWPQLRAYYRMGDHSSGTTLENHTWQTIASGVSGSLTCTNNTGTDIVSDSID